MTRNRDIEIHLDVNMEEQTGSGIVMCIFLPHHSLEVQVSVPGRMWFSTPDRLSSQISFLPQC